MEGERTPLLHPSRQPDTAPEDEEEIVDGPRDCSQWRRQLVGIELAGCLHSFSSGLHEVSQPCSSYRFQLDLGCAGDPQQPDPREGVPGELEPARVSVRRHSGPRRQAGQTLLLLLF